MSSRSLRLVPSGVATHVRDAEDRTFGPFVEITPADRDRYRSEFASAFPELSALLASSGTRVGAAAA